MTALSFRANMFWAAKEIFRYPRQNDLEENIEDFQELLDWYTVENSQPRQEASSLHCMDPGELQQLQVDFTGLFINGVPIIKAHPYAGWYEGESIMFGLSDQKMREFYALYGIDYDESQRVPADNIAVEFEFLAIMAEKYEQTGEWIYLNALREMVNQHMVHWVFKFLQDIKDHARTDYYKNIAAILTFLINEVAVELREVA